MSEAQVIAASGGAARALPANQRRTASNLEYRAGASITAEGARFRVFFGFDRRGLRCVSTAAEDPAQAPALRAWITRRFGAPQQIGGDESETILTWSRPDDIRVLVQQGAAVALHCASGTS